MMPPNRYTGVCYSQVLPAGHGALAFRFSPAQCIIRPTPSQAGLETATWRQLVEKQEFEQLVDLLKEVNKHLDHIGSHLEGIDKSLEKIRAETKKKRESPFDI